MLHKLSKSLFLTLLVSLQSNAMDHKKPSVPLSPALSKCIEAYNAEYQNKINTTLIEVTLHQEHPVQLLDALIEYHKQSSYPSHLDEIFKKMKAYAQLSRALTKEICAPAAANLSIEQSEDPDTALQEFYDLKQEIWDREWPLVSVDCELEIMAGKIEGLKKTLQKDEEKLPIVVEQQSLQPFKKSLDFQSNTIKKAREIIQKRLLIYRAKQDPIKFLQKEAHKKTLRYSLAQLKSVYPIQAINDDFKKSNPEENSLLHALCLKQLNQDEFSEAIILLTGSDGININNLNKSNKTVLDCLNNTNNGNKSELITAVKALGGKTGKSLYTKLTWSDERQPHSPDRAAIE